MSIRDLDELLAELTVSQRLGSWCMVSGVALSDDVDVAAMVTEAEGTTVVISAADAMRMGREPEFVAAWLTLNVDSTLDAVGLTAAVSSALAADGIPCNMLAGYHHDHLLVPIESAERAIASYPNPIIKRPSWRPSEPIEASLENEARWADLVEPVGGRL